MPLALRGRRLDAGLDLGRVLPRTRFLGELDATERMLALDDAERAVTALFLHEVVEGTRLANPLGDVRRERRRDLALLQQPERELRLLDRRDDALGLRHELSLAEPAGRQRRADEPLRVLGAHVVVDALLDRLGAQLGNRVTRVDALRAALVAEVAPRAVPDPMLLVIGVEPLDIGVVARVADEPHALRERCRPQ